MRLLMPTLLLSLTIGSGTPLHAQQSWVEQLLTAARLPVETATARREGLPSGDLRSILDAMRTNKVPAYEAAWLIDTVRVARRDNGPVDNFGAFVQSQLAAGKRGRALASAIRAEHARHGNKAARGSDAGEARGRSDDAEAKRGRGNASDTARGKGRSDAMKPDGPAGKDQKPVDRGKPAGKPAGKPDKPNT